MTTINLRSTKELTRYVQICDRLATIERTRKELEQEEKKLRPAIIEEIGDRREIAVRGQVRVLIPHVKESIGQADTEATVARFIELGLPVAERSPQWIPPATFSKLVKEGSVPDDLIKRSTETLIVIT
jgi:hypothetical protein